ncbi:NAD(P)-dependent oxidoreductase [Streptomyces sp. PT12]|uniref:NAD-dependent epimerase/dehydratase family protein n=1 Tax=Streptomyces sp. PT12 TaxID=1510197 RepID=UPI000DE57440|nr:NAD(P)-dependent oxidoreductase [Streptomyces sp. PT12]RBM12327.1 NAD-dependent dehydratase [Streptomyces sp. PT12]
MTASGAVVLGGHGFIGRHVCAALRRAGWSPVALGSAETAAGRSLDILLAAHAPAVVVNAAGAVWTRDPGELHAANVVLTERVVAEVAAARPRPRLIHLGSSLEYAPTRVGVPCREDSPTGPATRYGHTKLQATTRVLDAVAAGSLDAVVLRLFNAFGPGAHPASLLGRLAGRLRVAAATRAPVTVPLPRPVAYRDFVDVRDVADAVVAVAPHGPGTGVEGALFNVGSGTALATDDLVRGLVRASGVPAVLVDEPDGPSVRPGGPPWQCADIARARRLGWRPRRAPERTLRDLWTRASHPMNDAP